MNTIMQDKVTEIKRYTIDFERETIEGVKKYQATQELEGKQRPSFAKAANQLISLALNSLNIKIKS